MNKNKKNNEDIYINGKLAIAVLVTFSLLVITLVGMFVCLALDSSGSSEYVSLSDDGGSKQVSTNKQDTPVSVTSQPGKKTGIVLPCATDSANYISSSASDKTVLGDDLVKSKCAILVELTGNTSTVEKNSDTIIYPASMTKVMTLLVACEKALDPNAMLTVTQDMVDYQQQMGASGILGFSANDSISVEDALYLINYNSDTIACLLIAEYVAGSEEKFVELMNQKAKDLKLVSTNFKNCTGLYDKSHYTTCREMAAMMACAMRNTTAKKIITSYVGYVVNVYVNGNETRSPTVYSAWYSIRLNNNNWAGNGSDIKIIGGKTGYEDIPTACFVTVGKHTKTGKEYVCVTVGRIDKTTDKVKEEESTADTKVIYQEYAKE